MSVDARELFAPLGPTYDRVGATLSLGQDPRWRRFLVGRLPVDGGEVLDVATGTGLVAAELVRRGFRVTGLDQSASMLELAAARRDVGQDLPRGVDPGGDAEWLSGRHEVEQVMRDGVAGGGIGLGGADVHAAIHQRGVERHDLHRLRLGHLERERGLAAGGRACDKHGLANSPSADLLLAHENLKCPSSPR